VIPTKTKANIETSEAGFMGRKLVQQIHITRVLDVGDAEIWDMLVIQGWTPPPGSKRPGESA